MHSVPPKGIITAVSAEERNEHAMPYQMDLTRFIPSVPAPLGEDFTGTNPDGESISFNSYYMERDGRPFFPVSGEFHYSRMDERRWEDELIKMRMAGITIVSTYIFWNHVEEEEGVFDFRGRRDLRRFVELCGRHRLQVILRIGPFAHGEARNGGLPDWLYGKPFEVRTTHPEFLKYVSRLYQKIGEQVRGLFYRDGGPVIGVQLDNEYMHAGAVWEITTGISNEWVFAGSEGEKYILALRELALQAGIAPVFFTGTAWGGAAYSPRILPLWGGYAYRPWLFYSHSGEHPATEEYLYGDFHHEHAASGGDFTPPYPPDSRPYACCEMGAGMMCCYYYRFIYPFRSVDAMANIKLASGCNFLGYYMFHGGTNPRGKHGLFLNESQVSKISYDYQAALGEFGQIRESYSRLKTIHFFTESFGDRLAPLETVLPEDAAPSSPEDTETPRFALRTDGERGFLFLNNFQDHLTMPDRKDDVIRIRTSRETFEFHSGLRSEENAILPFRFDMEGICLLQACAQPVLKTRLKDRTVYVFMIPEGLDGSFRFEEGTEITGDRKCFEVHRGEKSVTVLLLTREETNRLFRLKDGSLILTEAALLEDEKGMLRLETDKADNLLLCFPPDRLEGHARYEGLRGAWGMYRKTVPARNLSPAFEQAAPFRWRIRLPENALEGLKDVRLQVDYLGDIGMLFLDNDMISDHFCNGDTWETGLMEHADRLSRELVLKIAPLREGAKVHVESAMAARNEEVLYNRAEIRDVRLRPVYDLSL